MAEHHATTVFLSYRRKDAEHSGEGIELSQVERIEQYLKACGLRVWRDLTTMKDGHMFHADIAQAIEDCDVFLLYITPNALDEGSYIWTHEVRAALAREARHDHIVIIPLFHGVKIEDVASIADGLYDSLGYTSLTSFQGIKLREQFGETIAVSSLHDIAQRVLRVGLETHLARVGATQAHEMWLHFWAAPQYETLGSQQYDLEVDWHDLFAKDAQTGDLLYPSQEHWQHILLPALDDMVDVINRQYTSKVVHVFSKARLSAAVAFGFAFRNMTTTELLLERTNANDGRQTWSTRVAPFDNAPLEVIPMQGFGKDSQPDEALVVAAVSQDITEHEGREEARLLGLAPRYFVQLKAKHDRSSVKGAADALAKAEQIRQQMNKLRKEHGVRHIHLFIAAPVELAILLGLQLNATGKITVYDYANGHYKAGPTLSS